MAQYVAKFMELSYFAPMYVLNQAEQAQKFEDGLRVDLIMVAIMRI